MKKIISVFVLLAMIFSLVIHVIAAEPKNANGYNVTIVMDSSGSLKYTDPNNYRYSAVNLFIQLLENKSNKLGCLSFSDDVSNQKKMMTINQSVDKQEIYDALTSTQADGWTNIGKALQTAVVDINSNGDKSKPSVILLFSDGNTEMSSEKELRNSLDAKADAVQSARDNNIAIFSVCLNADGKADKKEMEQISKATGGEFIEIRKAEDLQNALTTFYSMIYGTSVKTIVDSPFDSTGKVVVPFEVPYAGVREINIIIYGRAKDIVITRPDNQRAKYDVVEAETVSFLKVLEVVPGKWVISVSGVPGDKIKVDLLFNTDLSVVTNIKPNQDSFNPDDKITFEATLNSENEKAETNNNTNGFEATLKLTDVYGDVIEETPMAVENGTFVLEKQLEEGRYRYSVIIQGYNIKKESEIKGPFIISSSVNSQEELANKAPVPKNEDIKIKINLWPFKDNTFLLDVTDLAVDEQKEPIDYRIVSSSYMENEDYTFDGKTLEIKNFSLSKGEFFINAYDKFGESCQITIHIITRNIGLIAVILLVLISILIGLILIFAFWILSHKAFMGEITVTNLNGYQASTQRKGRGKIKMSAFLIGSTGINNNSYFQATGKDYVFFVSKVPVESDSIIGRTKKIKIENNFDVRIYSDSTHEHGIEVRFHSFKY